MKSLTLIHQTIRQHEGLYSLNDLHLAAGGEARHRPNYFLDNEQTQALIAELLEAGNPASKCIETVRGKGKAQGTYACKELVIAYAAWISAAFHLKVIGVFLASVQPPALPPTKQAKEALDVMDKAIRVLKRWGFKENACLISANQYTRKHTQIDVLADTGNTALVAENQTSADYTPTELGMRIGGLSGRKVNEMLAAAGLQVQDEAKKWLPTDKAEGHYVWHDTSKAHGSGTPVKQLKWYDSVLPLIQDIRKVA